jgi:prepilin-type N-terminal cleavage/methylation domain-containing protein/prepilin-type processing-associated H-X9-DG protein
MKKSAFTLIELLVVIVVIAILAGIALPVYGKVLERSRATTCGSNLKQLGLGIAAYLNDNDEQIFSTAAIDSKFWPEILQTKYVTNWKVFKCPFDKRADAATETPASVNVSYGINANVLAQTTGPGNWDGNFSKLASPSQLVLMAPAMTTAPGVPTFTGLGNAAVSLTQPTAGTVKLGTHNGRAQINVLFADTHLAPLRYLPSTDIEAFTNTTGETGLKRWKPLGL